MSCFFYKWGPWPETHTEHVNTHGDVRTPSEGVNSLKHVNQRRSTCKLSNRWAGVSPLLSLKHWSVCQHYWLLKYFKTIWTNSKNTVVSTEIVNTWRYMILTQTIKTTKHKAGGFSVICELVEIDYKYICVCKCVLMSCNNSVTNRNNNPVCSLLFN